MTMMVEQPAAAVASAAAGPSAAAAMPETTPPLALLPRDLLVRGVIAARLSPDDRRALRASSRLGRELVEAAATSLSLSANAGAAAVAAVLPQRLPRLRCVAVDGAGDPDAELEAALPGLLASLPGLRELRFSGPPDRRAPPAVDVAPAIAALGERAAADAAGQGLGALELRAGRLPDALLLQVGRLGGGLRRLTLSATSAMDVSPMAGLRGLSRVELTVAPPLAASVLPLTALTGLRALSLAVLQPVRGWGAALHKLGTACPLEEVKLSFADVCDGDLAGLAPLAPSLRRLDLACTRHLTGACVRHLALLRRLEELRLDHTGAQLGALELGLLAGGCPRLARLHAEWDLRAVDEAALEEEAEEAAAGVQRLTLGGDAARVQCSLWPPQALSHVGVSGGVSAANLRKLLLGCGDRLTALQLDSLGPCGQDVAAALVRRAPPLLRQLALGGCSSMDADACAALGASLARRSLEELRLVDVSVPGAALMALFEGLAAAGNASSQFCWSDGGDGGGGGGGGISSTPPRGGGSSLRRLLLERVAALDDGVLRGGVGRLARLEQLSLVALPGVSGGALLSLLMMPDDGEGPRLRRLARLTVRGCAGVRQDFVRAAEVCVADAVRAAPGQRAPLERVEWSA